MSNNLDLVLHSATSFKNLREQFLADYREALAECKNENLEYITLEFSFASANDEALYEFQQSGRSLDLYSEAISVINDDTISSLENVEDADLEGDYSHQELDQLVSDFEEILEQLQVDEAYLCSLEADLELDEEGFHEVLDDLERMLTDFPEVNFLNVNFYGSEEAE